MPADIKPAPKRRPWFQVHLSTCVILMFVAGGLLWANVREMEMGQVAVTAYSADSRQDVEVTVNGRGWPFLFQRRSQWTLLGNTHSFTVWDSEVFGAADRDKGTRILWDSDGGTLIRLTSSAPWALVVDVLTGLAVLALVGFLCEWPIRRRAMRAGR